MNAPESTAGLIDLTHGTQSKRIFWDPDLYQQELTQIFARSWLFLAHESQLPAAGDFVTTYMGEDKVIVARQDDGSVKAFINSCAHRGNQLCHADSGNAKSFVCNYHGWAFGNDGALNEAPLSDQAYHGELDKGAWGLHQVPRIESYRGFVFGCFDPEVTPLLDYLGEMAWYMDSFCDSGGGAELIGPPMKSILACNWKVPAENFIGDGYHIGWTHAAALQLIGGPLGQIVGNGEIPFDDLGLQITSRHGHGFGVIWEAAHLVHGDDQEFVDWLQSQTPDVANRLGEWRARFYRGHWNAGIFPNCSFLYGTNTFKVWHPRGPDEIEVWTWTLVQKNMPESLKRKIQKAAIFTFGTAGVFEADDGENMETCSNVNRGVVTRQDRMNVGMGLGHEGPHPELPGILGKGFVGETSYRGFYRFWQEMLRAPDWNALRAGDAHWTDLWLEQGGANAWKE